MSRCAGCWPSSTTIWPAGGTSCAVDLRAALVGELVPGGIDKEVVVNQVRSLLESVEPDDVAAVERHRQAVELVDEIEHLDVVIRDSKARIITAVEASGTTPARGLRGRPDRRLHAHRLQR